MEGNSNGYINYQTMLSQVNESMAGVISVCDKLNLEDYAKSLQESQKRMQNRVFSVGIMGEFRRGKSTVINALLGRSIVPSDIVPTSATLNYIRWDTAPRADIEFKDGTHKEVGVDELDRYITKITKASAEMAATVEKSVVYYPCPFCQNGVEIVDTPGLNDDERMTAISEQVIPTLDAIIMVLVPDSPFSQSESDFVRNKVMTSDLGRIIFVLNKIDNIRPREREKLIAHIRNSIEESVLEKVAAVYGNDSAEYQEARTKLGGIRLYPISARDALDGKLDNDPGLVEKSGMPAFEEALSRLLTEERGMLELISPVNAVLSVSKEAEKAINMRTDALQLEAAEFEQIQREAMEQIERSREEKKAEVAAVKDRAGSLYNDLLPLVSQAYPAIEENLQSFVDNYPITAANVKNEKASAAVGEKFTKDVEQQITSQLSAYTEKMVVEIQNRVGEEMIHLSEFAEGLSEDLSRTQVKLTQKKSSAAFDWGVVAVDALTNGVGLWGIGGILSGFKEHGLPGALAGGAVGFAAGMGSAVATVVAGATIGLTGGFLVLPVLVISGIASTFAGKGAVRAIFSTFGSKDKEIAALRSELRKYAGQYMDSVRKNRPLETWLRTTTNDAYRAIAQQLDQDVESALASMQSNLTQIQLDLQKNAGERQSLLENMDQLRQKLVDACGKIRPVKEKLAGALNAPAEEG